MPERGLALTFGALLVIAIAAVFGLTNTKPSDIRNLLLGRGSSVAAAPSPAVAAAKVVPPAKHTGTRSRRAEPAQPAPAPAPLVLDIPVQIPPTPREADIRPSMSRTELVERFGAPDLVAAWSDSGKLNERLYYHRAEAELEIVVQNGRVVHTRTATN